MPPVMPAAYPKASAWHATRCSQNDTDHQSGFNNFTKYDNQCCKHVLVSLKMHFIFDQHSCDAPGCGIACADEISGLILDGLASGRGRSFPIDCRADIMLLLIEVPQLRSLTQIALYFYAGLKKRIVAIACIPQEDIIRTAGMCGILSDILGKTDIGRAGESARIFLQQQLDLQRIGGITRAAKS